MQRGLPLQLLSWWEEGPCNLDKGMIRSLVALSGRVASISSKEEKPQARICVSVSPVPNGEGLPDRGRG